MTYRKTEKKIIIAIPKGRILKDLTPILKKVNIIPEKEFFDINSRKILFSSNKKLIDFIKVRSFDVVNFVAYGGAHLGIVGLDVIEEFNYEEIYAPVNLDIGKCRLSIAEPLSSAPMTLAYMVANSALLVGSPLSTHSLIPNSVNARAISVICLFLCYLYLSLCNLHTL